MLSKNHTQASQNGQNRVNQSSKAKRNLIVVFGIVLWVFFIAQSAMAAGFTSSSKTRKAEVYKVHLDQLYERYEPRLDWRNPEYAFTFETPTSDWIEKLDFFVKIHAEGYVNRNAPIFIRFNDGEPVPVYSRGNSFEAMISLDTSRVKAHRNMISVSFDKANGCIDESDGAFSIDMSDSFLVVRTSTPSRPYYLRDVKQILTSPLTTPKTVSIKAYGPDRLKYQALAAQGMALNMPSLPRFSVDGTGDAQVYIGTRREIPSIIAGTELAKREGPVIGVTRNAPLRLVMTADTQEELNAMVKAFASKELPPARRAYAFAGEYAWQQAFAVDNAPVQGKTPIYELGTLRFDRGWGNSAQSVTFDVDNPLSAQGIAKLYFQKSPNVSPESKVNIHLNGKNLGQVLLNSKRSAAQIEIPAGILVGTDNVLTINPELTPKDKTANCEKKNVAAGFAVGAKSYLKIKSTNGAYAGDLTRLAASGYPFSNGAGDKTAIVFATSKNSDQAAALRAFAQLGKAYGTGWVNAEFYNLSGAPRDLDKHALFIGPRSDTRTPRGLTAEVDGRVNTPTSVRTAEVTTAPSISLLSMRSTVKGGVMAIYESEQGGLMNGFLTSSRGHSFTRAVDQIIKPGHWNKLQGSVARWDRNRVEMAKTAFKTDIVAEHSDQENASTLVDLSDVSMPNVSIPKITIPEISLPDLTPVLARLQRGTDKARVHVSNGWTGVQTLSASLFKAEPEPTIVKTSPTYEAGLPELKTTPAPKPIASPIVRKPRIPPQRPIIVAAPVQPIETPIQPIESGTTEMFQSVRVPSQYKPGATLRGLSEEKAETPKIDTRAQYQPISERTETTAASSIKTRFNAASSWIGKKLNALSGSGASVDENRQANFILFAIAVSLLLLLLALAKPESYRD